MGIDVEFYFKPKKPLSVRELDQFREVFYDRFDRVCVDDIRFYQEDDSVIELCTLCRYYGEYYARVNPLPWIAYAEFVEWYFPDCLIVYQGDCSDFEPSQMFHWTREEREQLKLFYYQNGTAPYHDKFKANL